MKKLLLIALLGVLLAPQLTFAMPTDIFLDKLAEKENCGEGVYDPPRKIVDERDNYSYGDLCFKIRTFHSMGIKYDLWDKRLTLEDAELLIHNTTIQRAIAREMYEDGIACKSIGWLNSCKKLGLV